MASFAGPRIPQDSSIYNYHICTVSGTFIPNFTGNIEVLVVAGGGGGGMDMAGGGGGGGVLTSTSYAVTSGTGITVTVGAGGAGAPAAGTAGQGFRTAHNYITNATQGGNSVFGSLTAIGGGYGGSSYRSSPLGGIPGNGGSGGGASGYNNDAGVRAGGTGTAGQGNNGGAMGTAYYSGGGGGAGAAGADGNNTPNGGAGILNNILGIDYYWGGGGGGSAYSAALGGNGGIGGGGGGALGYTVGGTGLNPGLPGGGGRAGTQTNCHGGHGGANTGGGGGGGAHYFANNFGGNGGSGIVIIRYLKSLGTSTFNSSGAIPQNSLVFSFDAANLAKSSVVEVLVVAGGGGGGMDMGGGGGGGGVIYRNAYSVQTSTPITVTVGAGGAGAPNQYNVNPVAGSVGSNSVFGGLVARGGGGGGSGHREPPWGGQLGQIGGCGGGDSARYIDPTTLYNGYTRDIFDTSQGYDGGKGAPPAGYHAGGGGGAGQPGGGGGNTFSGNGGQGFLSAINGTSLYWAGGGGGSDYSQVSGNGGLGGGGGGSAFNGTAGTGGAGLNAGANGTVGNSVVGGAGGANTGGGGGGGSHSGGVGGAGGSGIVIVRYYGSQQATGGTITSSGGYTIHTFTSSDTFTPTGFIGAKDLSDRNNTMTVIGPTYSSDNGGSLVFDGVNDYVNIGIGTGLNQFSGDFAVSAWVFRNAGGPTFGNVIGDYYTGSVATTNEWQIMMSNTAQFTLYRVGSGSIFSNIASGYSASQWINVVVSRIGSTISMYANNNLIASTTNSEVFGTATGNLNIGIDGNNSAEPLSAKIANVVIYKNKGLSASEIQQNFNALRSRYAL